LRELKEASYERANEKVNEKVNGHTAYIMHGVYFAAGNNAAAGASYGA
jgi:hypothetical protein